MKRIAALRVIVAECADLPIVATCAATSRELAAVDDAPNHLYLLDSMGLTSSVGTGLALAIEGTPVNKVVVIDGDGSLLMNPNALTTGGYLKPRKLMTILLDNGVYASTAGLPTYAEVLDLGSIAAACGWRVLRASTEADLRAELRAALAGDGPSFLHVRIEAGNQADTPLYLEDPVVIGRRFRNWLTVRMEARG